MGYGLIVSLRKSPFEFLNSFWIRSLYSEVDSKIRKPLSSLSIFSLDCLIVPRFFFSLSSSSLFCTFFCFWFHFPLFLVCVYLPPPPAQTSNPTQPLTATCHLLEEFHCLILFRHFQNLISIP